MKRIAVVGGDGIGPEVIESAMAVLDAVGFQGDFVPLKIGLCRWRETGEAMGEDDLETIKSCDCVLLGAITTPSDPKYKSVLLRLRRTLDLYANIRPFRSTKLDLVIVRENTEGLYSGLEEIGEEESRSVRVITKHGSERIANVACNLALNRKMMTIVHKSNVLKSDLLFLKTCQQVAKEVHVPYDDMLVDAAAYNLVIRPKRFDVIVTTNLFGDILSDECAGVLGSLGLCASANIGDRYALFEPIHGSAPDIAGKGISNPIGAVRSVSMLLDWLGDSRRALKVERAVYAVLANGMTTPDLGGNMRTSDVTRALVQNIEMDGN